jgi:co-chaperonin GroES (HSP10)
MTLPLRVLGDRLLVALPPKAETQDEQTGYTVQDLQQTASGLYLAKPTDQYNVEIATRGIVVQLGDKRGVVDLDDVRAEVNEWFMACDSFGWTWGGAKDAVDRVLTEMAPAGFDVAVGDCVLFPPSAGEQIQDGDITYVVLRESEIIGVVEPHTKDEAA